MTSMNLAEWLADFISNLIKEEYIRNEEMMISPSSPISELAAFGLNKVIAYCEDTALTREKTQSAGQLVAALAKLKEGKGNVERATLVQLIEGEQKKIAELREKYKAKEGTYDGLLAVARKLLDDLPQFERFGFDFISYYGNNSGKICSDLKAMIIQCYFKANYLLYRSQASQSKGDKYLSFAKENYPDAAINKLLVAFKEGLNSFNDLNADLVLDANLNAGAEASAAIQAENNNKLAQIKYRLGDLLYKIIRIERECNIVFSYTNIFELSYADVEGRVKPVENKFDVNQVQAQASPKNAFSQALEATQKMAESVASVFRSDQSPSNSGGLILSTYDGSEHSSRGLTPYFDGSAANVSVSTPGNVNATASVSTRGSSKKTSSLSGSSPSTSQ